VSKLKLFLCTYNLEKKKQNKFAATPNKNWHINRQKYDKFARENKKGGKKQRTKMSRHGQGSPY